MSLGQDEPIEPQEPQQLNFVIPPEPGQIGKNIHFVVDFSGSMDRGKLAAAIQQTIDIASQSVDEINIKVTAFAHNRATWEGIENKKQPGWTALPSKEAIEALTEWCYSLQLITHSTYVGDPVRNALTEDIENMTVIVISDMCFDDPSDLNGWIVAEQGRRIHKATLGFIGISPGLAYALSIANRCKEWGAWNANLGVPSHQSALQNFLGQHGY